MVKTNGIVSFGLLYIPESIQLAENEKLLLLFTLVPVLLIIHQVNSSSNNKKQSSIGVMIEYLVVFLSICCVISMWIWIKFQYTVLGVLLEKQHEANILNDLETMYKYEEIFKSSVAFMLFFVLIKVFHVVIVDKFLDYLEPFEIVVNVVSCPLFALLLLFVAFAHMGVSLFGDHLKMFGSFWQALSLNVAYLRRTCSENLVVDTPYQQMLLALYVIGFCSCVIPFSNLVKAAFCQARINFSLTMKTKRRIPIKVYVIRKIRRIFSLLRSYLEEHEHEEETLKHVPVSYILKELDEQVNDLEFRVTHLTCKENMPNKTVPSLTADECSSSDGSDVEYVYSENNERPSFSSMHRDLSSSNGSCFEYPNHENIAESDVECISRKSSSASGSMTIHAETKISKTSKLTRRRPFEQSMPTFPTPINENLTSYGHLHVLLDPFLSENGYTENGKSTAEFFSEDHKLASAEKESVLDDSISWNRYARKSANHTIDDHEHSPPIAGRKRSVECCNDICTDDRTESKRKDMDGNKRSEINVNSFTNTAFEGDLEDPYDNIMPSRPKLRLDAFANESFEEINDNENCSEAVQPSFDTSLSKKSPAGNVRTTEKKPDVSSDKQPFRQPVFPLTISHTLTRSSEV